MDAIWGVDGRAAGRYASMTRNVASQVCGTVATPARDVRDALGVVLGREGVPRHEPLH